MAFGFLKDKLAKASEKVSPSLASVKDKLNPMLSKIATATGNAMSDMGLLAANPDREPKPVRTIDEENLHEDVAHGLLMDYSTIDPQAFVSILNKIAKECHGLHNLGIYADIVSVTPSHALKFETKDNFIHVECFNAESPGNGYDNDGTSENPFQHPFDELLAGGDADESDEGVAADAGDETEGEGYDEEESVEDEEEGESDEAEDGEEYEEEDGEEVEED